MSLVSQISGPSGGDFPREFNAHSTSMHLNSTVETFHLFGFMDLLEENSVSNIEHIPFLMNQYCRGLFGQNTYDEIGLKAVEFLCTRLWSLCTRNAHNHTTSNPYMHSSDPNLDPALYSSPHTTYTPPSDFYSSPPTCYAQPLVPAFRPVANLDHDTQLYESPLLLNASLACANGILNNSSSAHRPECYKEVELENDRRQPFKWFDEFLKTWTDEHKYGTENDVVTYINANQYYIECLFHALQEVVTDGAEGETTFDLPKWEQVRDSISQPQFYYAAVQTCYTIEKRLRIGPIQRNRAHSRIGDNIHSRVQAVANYYRLCKNSCLRVCLPHFIDEIVDQPEKMKERFHTNCKGNKEKQKRNEAKRTIEAVKAAPVRRKLDQMPPTSSRTSHLEAPLRARDKQSSTAPAGGVSKRRQIPPRGTGRAPPIYREVGEEEDFLFIDNETDNLDDQYDGDSIRVAHVPSIDPSLLNIQGGMGIHQLQWH